MTRQIIGLTMARRLEARPPGIPVGRPRGAKAFGIRYERALAKALPIAEAGVWWEFQDRNGTGVCQTDLIIIGQVWALVLEAKYTYTVDAWRQLMGLYCPVVERALARPVLLVQVCKNLTPVAQRVTRDLGSAIAMAKESSGEAGAWATLHWSGVAPLWTGSAPSARASVLARRPALLAA